jgi:glycerol-3-phosphate acyltransferase PlsX
MNIALDMMGGDFAPREAVKGVALYLRGFASPAVLFLIGDENLLNPLLEEFSLPRHALRIVHAPEVIGMDEHPTKALKEKQQSSIATGFRLLASGEVDALISAGNTGAMLVGSIYSVKMIEGIQRPAIATIIPKENDQTGLLLDVGLNADCKPEQLNQFATLGTLYAKYMLSIEAPRVGLINVGEEEGKGNILVQAAYPLLKDNEQIRFIGNIEGRDILRNTADVMVCDGFTGNIILKMTESIFGITRRQGIRNAYFDRFEFEQYGGTPVLGVSKPVIIGHGISQAGAFSNMITEAAKVIDTGLLSRIEASFGKQ